MRGIAIGIAALALAGCGSVQNPGGPDAAVADAPGGGSEDAPDTSPHLVFVTSTRHSGALGGLAGADGICQARALAAGLPKADQQGATSMARATTGAAWATAAAGPSAVATAPAPPATPARPT